MFILEAQNALLKTVGSALMENWDCIDKNDRSICKRILFYSFSHEVFEESELAKEIFSGWWFWKDSISKYVQSLVKANILSKISYGTYTLHSKVEKEFLASNMHKLS